MTVLAAGPAETIISGPFLLAGLLAVAAGVVSFASPCVLPLVPGYLSYLVGLVGREGHEEGELKVRTRAVVATAWFVTGFTVMFLIESMAVLGVMRLITANSELITRVSGVVVILLGLAMLGFLRPLQVERRIHAKPRGAFVGPILLGGIFALGWTVCIGPTLGGVLALANSTGWNDNAWRGLFLVLLYCLGLGVPFLLVAFGFGWATSAMGLLRRHSRSIQLIGGAMLVAIGLLMVTGIWSEFLAWLQLRLAGFGEGLLL